MTTPKVSVVMSVYNGEKYLWEAVDSILNQTFTNFEFIIINDGSTDGTYAILESYDDSRIVSVHNPENSGLTPSLNKGLALAQGEYVARMDADDVAMPHRFEEQVVFLEKHPEIGILGSSCQMIDTNDQEQELYQVPTSDLQIRWTSLLKNPFAHPTVMIRRDVLTQNGLHYDEAFQTAQDYDLWIRLLKHTRGANLSEPLIRYRLCYGVTNAHREAQLKNHDTIALRTIREQSPNSAITLQQVGQLRVLFVGGNQSIPDLDKSRVALAELYCDLFTAFARCYRGEPDLKALQRREAWKIARAVLHAPLLPGWTTVLRRSLSLHPGLLWSLLRYLLDVGYRRLRRPLAIGQLDR